MTRHRPLRLVLLLDADPDRHSPIELRDHFLDAIRAAVTRAEGAGRIDSEIAAELWRALPARSPRR